MLPTESIKGQRFGRLQAVSFAGYFSSSMGGCRNAYWTCRCDCGTVLRVRANSLRSGRTKSCGCLRKSKGNKAIHPAVSVINYT